jgi:thiamine biosynthesis lipoprotein
MRRVGLMVVGVLWALPVGAAPAWHTRAEYIMGSLWQITLYGELTQVAPALDAAFAEIRHWDHVLSDYRTDSELNQALPRARQDWTPVSSDLSAAISAGQYYHQQTSQAFDLTLGPLVALWGFKDKQPYRPTQAEIRTLLGQSGMGKIQLQTSPPALRVGPHTGLDFGAMGKGWAVDQAVMRLHTYGITTGVIDSLSTQYYLGAPPGELAWKVAIRHPRDPEQTLETLLLRDQAISTSGDDQQTFVMDGVRYPHILDPRTGMPVAGPASVTAISKSATASDVLSTAGMILGEPEARASAKTFAATLIRWWPPSVPDAAWHRDVFSYE